MGLKIFYLIAEVVQASPTFQEARYRRIRPAWFYQFDERIVDVRSFQEGHSDLLERIKKNVSIPGGAKRSRKRFGALLDGRQYEADVMKFRLAQKTEIS